jgi:hypothetical protein
LPDHLVDLCLDFEEASKFFFRVLALAFPPAVYKDSFFPTSPPTPVVGGVFDGGYSNG